MRISQNLIKRLAHFFAAPLAQNDLMMNDSHPFAGHAALRFTLQVACGAGCHEVLVQLTKRTVGAFSPCRSLPAAVRQFTGSTCATAVTELDEALKLVRQIGGPNAVVAVLDTIGAKGMDVAHATDLAWMAIACQCGALAEFGDASCFEIIFAALRATRETVVQAAVKALKQIVHRNLSESNQSALSAVVQTAGTADLAIALSAVRLLPAFGAAAIAPLGRLLDDGRPELRKAATEALGEMVDSGIPVPWNELLPATAFCPLGEPNDPT